jgi:hypothetical protein
MSVDWQSVIALCVVSVAAGYLFVHLRRMGRSKNARRCGGCPLWASTPDRTKLVTIELPDADRREQTAVDDSHG